MITTEQRERRRQRVGSSDSAAIMGVDPWRSAYDVWLSKVEDLEDWTSPAAAIGNLLERPLIEWAAKEIGLAAFETDVEVIPEGSVMAANLDARHSRTGIEGKTTSLSDQWGEPGTDQVPDAVIIQCHHQMVVADLDVVYVPVLLPRRGRLALELFVVDRDPQLCSLVVSGAQKFWDQHVRTRQPPQDSQPSMDVLKRLRREPETQVEIPQALITNYEQARAIAKGAAEIEDEHKRALLAAMGTAEAAYGDEDREQVYTYLEQSRAGVDLKRLKTQHPEIAAELGRVSTFRVLRKTRRKD